jgi:hypothetical protein
VCELTETLITGTYHLDSDTWDLSVQVTDDHGLSDPIAFIDGLSEKGHEVTAFLRLLDEIGARQLRLYDLP